MPDIAQMILDALPPFPFPPGTINPAVVAVVVTTMQEGLTAVQVYLDGLIPECPKE
jgi:hypothetical protein